MWRRMKGPEREEERDKGGEGEETEAQTFRPTLQQWSDLPRLGFERLKCVIKIDLFALFLIILSNIRKCS